MLNQNVVRLWTEYLVTGYLDQSEDAMPANREEAQYHAGGIVVHDIAPPAGFDEWLSTPANYAAALAYVIASFAALDFYPTAQQLQYLQVNRLPAEFSAYLRDVVAGLCNHG